MKIRYKSMFYFNNVNFILIDYLYNFMTKRLENEIEHGKFLLKNNAGEIWNWESAAGKLRWKRRVKMLCDNLSKDKSVLELGCGTGYFTKELTKTKAKITAIDISPELMEYAKSQIKSENIEFLLENAYSMGFEDSTFDVVLGSSVLHHLEIDLALKEIYRVLKKNGSIQFTEPNMLNPQIALQKNIPFIKKIVGDSPDESAFFRWKLKKKLIDIGFSSVRVIPFDFLHPKTPKLFINIMEKIGPIFEKTPLLKEFAGSLLITARK
jgi:ubiquinone/menaquinone biosynthesis C-methylase UbiE